MKTQRAGGSVGQSLQYVDTSAPERSAPAGSNLLVQQGLIARPAIGGGSFVGPSHPTTPSHRGGSCGTRKTRKGGFYPSIMSGVVSGGVITAPLAAFAARKLMTRKGGAKRANVWKAKKEEARTILESYGKPSASNIQKYAAAVKKGPAKAEEFLATYREEKMEQQMIENVKYQEKMAKLMEKSRAKAAKEAAKATKKAARNAAKAAKAANKATKQTKKVKNVNEDLYGKITKAEWATLVKAAKDRLKEVGKPSKENIELLASLMMNKKNTTQFITNFASRKPRTKKVRTITTSSKASNMLMMPLTTPASSRRSRRAPRTTTTTTTTAAAATSATTKAKPKYFEELSKARSYLGTIGAPTGPNMSRFASMKMKGENTSAWEENFKTRRPLSMAKPAKKPKTAAKKALTAVKEESSTENDMQGYSENFESESE